MEARLIILLLAAAAAVGGELLVVVGLVEFVLVKRLMFQFSLIL
jgi:hypothetical protein